MKAEKIRQVDTNELEGQVKDMQEQMFRLRFQMTNKRRRCKKWLNKLRQSSSTAITKPRRLHVQARSRAIT